MYLAQPDGKGGSTVFMTFAQALENLKIVDHITRGMPKIAYLMDWQYRGHDDKHPAWHEVNETLKRPTDATALASFLWLKREAQKYNTIVSVHINMTDAYPNSPLWDDYVKADLFGTYGVTPFVPEFKKQFCTTSLQTYFQNLRKLERYDKASATATYTDGLAICAKDMTVKENGRLLRMANDVFIPVGWKKSREILAFSEKGYPAKTWTLPPDWNGVKAVDVYTVTEKGLELKSGRMPVTDGSVTLALTAMEQVSILVSDP